jgi:hypothetical protein
MIVQFVMRRARESLATAIFSSYNFNRNMRAAHKK